MDLRLREAAKLGFKGAIIPKRLRAQVNTPKGFTITETRSLRQAIRVSLVEK